MKLGQRGEFNFCGILLKLLTDDLYIIYKFIYQKYQNSL